MTVLLALALVLSFAALLVFTARLAFAAFDFVQEASLKNGTNVVFQLAFWLLSNYAFDATLEAIKHLL